MNEPKTVAVTGIGVVSAIGIGRQAFWASLCAGRSGIAALNSFAVEAESPALAAEVRDFTSRDFIASAHLRRMDKLSRMIVAASRMAVDDGGIVLDRVAAERVGVVVGSAFGNVSESVHYLERVLTRGPNTASPMLFPNLVMNAPASYVAMELGATGTNLTVSQGETSGEHAIIVGADLVRSGRVDVAIVGGGDELCATIYEVYRRSRALSSQRGGQAWSSPYDAARNGIILGEGAAMLVLEPATRALTRGATAYAAIEGGERFAVAAPAYDWPAAAPAALRPLRHLVTGGGGGVATPDLICGSANSSRRLDGCELDLFAEVLGEMAGGVWLTSLKGAIGEIGAGGALSVAAACLALHTQTVPPLCHLRAPEPSTPFRFAAGSGQAQRLSRVLVSGLSRGGGGAALALRGVESEQDYRGEAGGA